MTLELHAIDDDRLHAEWDALADRAGASPFLRPGWISAWAAAFARRPVRVAVVRRGDAMVGVLPLLLWPGLVRSPANWHTPLFGPVAEDDAAAAELAAWLFECRPRQVALDFADPGAPSTRAFTGAASGAGYRVHSRPRLSSPYVEFDGTPTEARLTAKRRSNIRRQRRRLEKLGPLALEVHEEPSALDEALPVEASGWKGQRRTAIASRADTTRFYRDVAAWAAARGWLRILLLRSGERVVACDIGLDAGGAHHLLKTGYLQELGQYAPGVVLRSGAIERAENAGLAGYEFLGQAEPTKLEWTSTCRARVLVQAFAPTPLGRLERTLVIRGGASVRRAAARL